MRYCICKSLDQRVTRLLVLIVTNVRDYFSDVTQINALAHLHIFVNKLKIVTVICYDNKSK